ncbi:MAG: TonB-dependent receptor [Tannerellaceae bacterium]|nr:TonB-dependent receptor [Tannerellaceae bacterium]
MKIRTSLFLLFTLWVSPMNLFAQPGVDTLVYLPASTVYGSQTISLSGTEKSLYTGTDIVLVDGTVSEAFKQIPSLVTDIEGGVTYRGSNRSGMLLNGVPYGLLEEYNGDFLIQLPARFFERISVASFSPIEWLPDGDAGVVDMHSVFLRPQDSPLSFTIAGGWKERYNAGFILNQHSGRFHVIAKYNCRKELRERSFRKITTTPQYTAEQNNNASARPDIHLADLQVGYDLSHRDKLVLYGLYYHMDYDRYGKINNKRSAPDGNTLMHMFRHRNNVQQQKAAAVEARWLHQFNTPGEYLEMIFNYNNFGYDEENRYQNESVSNGNIIQEDNLFIDHTKHNYYGSVMFNKLFAGNWHWKSGYTTRFKEEEYSAAGTIKQNDAWVETPKNTNNYSFRRQNHMLFTSLEKEWDHWKIEPGVQLEYQHREMDGVKKDQFRVYPRIQLGYMPSAPHSVTFHYLQRSYRPAGAWLNHFIDPSDDTHKTRGNSGLKDEQIHSLELSYKYSISGFQVSPALYYRNRSNRIMEVAYEEGNDIIWQKENAGNSKSIGAELAVFWKPVHFFDGYLAGNLYRDEIDGRIAGYDATKSLVCGDIKTSFRFYLTPDTELQLDGFYISGQLTPQGRIKSHYTVNAGLSHYFINRKLCARLSIQNIFDTLEEATIIDTDNLQMRQERNRDPRMLWLSLSYDL